MIVASFIIIILFFIINIKTEIFVKNLTNDNDYNWHDTQYENCQNRSNINCYDYIIVGAGTAGTIVAKRLSDDPKTKVLLIEQGYWSSLNSNIQESSKWFSLLSDPLVTLKYISVPQIGLNNRQIALPRGKGTGGSNSINAMVFILGNRKDYDERWGPINGWTWNDLSSYWNYINNTFEYTQLHTNDSNMSILLKSAEELDYKYNPNPNNLDSKQGQGGVSPRIFMSKKISNTYAKRVSSWNAYMEPILPRRNLHILIFTHVNKIIFNKKTLKSIGVKTYNLGNKQYNYYYSKKDIILSAGAYDTPKLLLLSGIGPCNELNYLNITCLSNVKGVGKNLQDHTFIQMYSPPLINQNITLNNNIYSLWGAIAIENNGEYYHGLNIDEINNKKVFNIFIETFHYKSRGYVTLRNKNPLSDPIINPNYLSNSYDEQKLLKSLKVAQKFFSTEILKNLIENKTINMNSGYYINDDQQLLNWAKENLSTDFHPSSTCQMGNNFHDNDMTVVDKRLRVRNTKNLRIADASIMPTLISGNPNQITMIIGFKAADMILQDNKSL